MLKVLLGRQLSEDLLTARFFVGLALVLGAICAFSLVFADQYQRSQAVYAAAMAKNDRGLQQFAKSPDENLGSSMQTFLLRPRPELFIAESYEETIPQGLLYVPYNYPSLQLLSPKEEAFGAQNYRSISKRENLADVLTYSPDLMFIVQVLLSFFALILAYSAVTGEKERGTLGLIYSNSIKRAPLILAKYLSALLTIGVSLLLGLVLSLILLHVLSGVPLSSSLIVSFMFFLLVSLLYLSVFILLGIACSVLSQRSKNSLVLCLLAWVFLVIVLPKSTGMLLTLKRFDVPTAEEISQLAQKAARETEALFEKQFPPDWRAKYEEYRRNELFLKAIHAYGKAQQDVLDHYLRKKLSAIEAARKINFFSPASLFEYSASSVSGTGVAHFEKLWIQAQRYEDDFLSFVRDERSVLPKGSFFYLSHDTISNKPLDFNALPKFEDTLPPAGDRLKDALPYLGLLALYNLFLFAFVFYKFQTYDVR